MKALILIFASMMLSMTSTIDDEAINDSSHIQVAILLDTSGSMSGLIEQAKSQLWSILNTLSDASKNDQHATIEMALYEYGNDGLSSLSGWVSQRVGFTADMDRISQSLFAMSTNGGEEYCGEVIMRSVEDLEWKDNAGLRVVYIAGNESFAQGKISYREACKKANEREIVINTIYCGSYENGITEQWQSGAVLGNGQYNFIDHNQQTAYVPSPYDDKIARLNIRLNDTYIPMNSKGEEAMENMASQDQNAQSFSSANYVKRSIYKSKKVYNNASWDLVDAYEKDKTVIKRLEKAPKGFDSKEEEYVEKRVKRLLQERATINLEIKELADLRACFIVENGEKEVGLEKAIIDSVKRLLIKKQFKLN